MLQKLESNSKVSECISGKTETMYYLATTLKCNLKGTLPLIATETFASLLGGIELVWKRSIPQHAHAEQ